MAKAKKAAPESTAPQPPAAGLSLPGGMLPLIAKFVLVYAALLGLVYLLAPVIYPAFARAARDLLVLIPGTPRISNLSMQEALPLLMVVFRIDTPLHAGPLFVREPALAFTLLFPLALILALPRAAITDRWRRFGWVALAAVFYGGLVLAYVADNYLTTVVSRSEISAYPGWRDQIYAWTHAWSWSLSTIIFPLSASLYALAPSLLPRRDGATPTETAASPSTRTERRRALRRKRLDQREQVLRGRRAVRRQLVVFASVVVLAGLLDQVAEWRLRDLSSVAVARELERFNDDVGAFFLQIGEREAELGRSEQARNGFNAALRYPLHKAAAEQGLGDLRGEGPGTAAGKDPR